MVVRRCPFTVVALCWGCDEAIAELDLMPSTKGDDDGDH